MIRIYLTIGLIVLLLLLGGSCAWLYKQWRNEKDQKEQVIKFAGNQQKEATTYRNKYNQEVAKTQASELDNSTLREMVKSGAIKTDQFNKVKPKKIEGISQATIITVDTLSTAIFKDGSFSINTPFKGISGWVRAAAPLPDGLTIKLSDTTRVPLSAIVYWKRRGLLRWLGIGKKEYFGEVVSDNPAVKITRFTLVVKKKY